MASLLDATTLMLGLLPDKIRTEVFRQAERAAANERDIALVLSNITADEARTLIDCAIKIEQARNGDVLTPTEYGNRFSGLDLE